MDSRRINGGRLVKTYLPRLSISLVFRPTDEVPATGLTSLWTAPAPEMVGPTLQPPSGPILRSAPGEVTLEELGRLQQPAETPGPQAQRLLLLQSPAAGFHLLRQSSRPHPLATEWIPWPSSPSDPPPPSPS